MVDYDLVMVVRLPDSDKTGSGKTSRPDSGKAGRPDSAKNRAHLFSEGDDEEDDLFSGGSSTAVTAPVETK